jgi:hypothetical protein
MGMDLYLVTYKNAGVPRNYQFFELLEAEFRNDGGNIYIDTERWEDFLLRFGDDRETLKEEFEAIEKLLKENDGSIELDIN